MDNVFTYREYAAVKDWLKSDKAFHLMSDHPSHGSNIMGGMWGVKLQNSLIRNNWTEAWTKGFKDHEMWSDPTQYGSDQNFLDR